MIDWMDLKSFAEEVGGHAENCCMCHPLSGNKINRLACGA